MASKFEFDCGILGTNFIRFETFYLRHGCERRRYRNNNNIYFFTVVLQVGSLSNEDVGRDF